MWVLPDPCFCPVAFRKPLCARSPAADMACSRSFIGFNVEFQVLFVPSIFKLLNRLLSSSEFRLGKDFGLLASFLISRKRVSIAVHSWYCFIPVYRSGTLIERRNYVVS
ncbi:hypothetical protein HYC85_032194 [Camellia sinensis]|uniref:Uncharacterized protein n=1 Tax=Camellia sinensis TaxID=4442 RepID=A0A7J7FTI7_CAMSI|nr:hypothetical protein HYC85_032194 [Camellia sinensis]